MVFLLLAARDILLLHASFSAHSSISQNYRTEPFSVKCIHSSFDNGLTLRSFLKHEVMMTAPNYVVLMEQKIIQSPKQRKVLSPGMILTFAKPL